MGSFYTLESVFTQVSMKIRDFSVDRVAFSYLVTVEMDYFVRSFIHDGVLGFTLNTIIDQSL